MDKLCVKCRAPLSKLEMRINRTSDRKHATCEKCIDDYLREEARKLDEET